MEDTYYLQEEYLDPDSDDGFSYHEVTVDDAIESSGDEDLETALQNERATTKPDTLKVEPQLSSSPSSLIHPEVVDDFVRNFLVRMGMSRTAECFQSEWYELELSGKLKSHQTQHLPDVYSQNRQLELMLQDLQEQLASHKEAARLSKEKFVRLKKERDYHRMHHRRIVQEKTKLIADIKRMKEHFSNYEPMLQGLQHKYESVTKEKTLACIERDRAMSEVGCLQSTLQSVQQTAQPPPSGKAAPLQDTKQKPSQKHKVCEFPPEPSNPHRQAKLPVSSHLTRTGGLQQSSTVAAHQYATSSVSMHPTKPVAATTSDDHTWKMWALPGGELLMTGEGHRDWVGVADFHPSGAQLATASGDGTVKVWDFAKGECVLTFTEHQQPVWGCSWHWSGQFLVSGGMDHCCKLWDINNAKCVVTLRGHADSVNAVNFLPYSNTLATCSADKTISLWDARTGLCVQTFYGHHHSCNDIIPTLQGSQLYSCDCLGTVQQWDVRMQAAQSSWDLGPFPVSKLALDPAGAVLACASGDNLIRLLDTGSQSKEWELEGHADSVLGVCFSRQADFLLSCASDGSLIQWQ